MFQAWLTLMVSHPCVAAVMILFFNKIILFLLGRIFNLASVEVKEAANSALCCSN